MTKEIGRLPKIARTDYRVAQMFAFYVFTGGAPHIVLRRITVDELSEDNRFLIQGAAAFVQGRRHDAIRLLKDRDPLSLPPMIGGQLALAQAALAEENESVLRLKKLSQVRILLPGSIAEEAALRRATKIAATTNRPNDSLFFLEQYQRRFSRSPYAKNFQRIAASVLSRVFVRGDTSLFSRACTGFERLEHERAFMELISSARLAVGEGRLESLRGIGECLVRLSKNESQKSLGLLYLVASNSHKIQMQTFESSTLDQVDVGLLDGEHQMLYFSIRQVWSQMNVKANHVMSVSEKRPSGQNNQFDELIKRAELVVKHGLGR